MRKFYWVCVVLLHLAVLPMGLMWGFANWLNRPAWAEVIFDPFVEYIFEPIAEVLYHRLVLES